MDAENLGIRPQFVDLLISARYTEVPRRLWTPSAGNVFFAHGQPGNTGPRPVNEFFYTK